MIMKSNRIMSEIYIVICAKLTKTDYFQYNSSFFSCNTGRQVAVGGYFKKNKSAMPVFDTADVWFVVIKLLADGNKIR